MSSQTVAAPVREPAIWTWRDRFVNGLLSGVTIGASIVLVLFLNWVADRNNYRAEHGPLWTMQTLLKVGWIMLFSLAPCLTCSALVPWARSPMRGAMVGAVAGLVLVATAALTEPVSADPIRETAYVAFLLLSLWGGSLLGVMLLTSMPTHAPEVTASEAANETERVHTRRRLTGETVPTWRWTQQFVWLTLLLCGVFGPWSVRLVVLLVGGFFFALSSPHLWLIADVWLEGDVLVLGRSGGEKRVPMRQLQAVAVERHTFCGKQWGGCLRLQYSMATGGASHTVYALIENAGPLQSLDHAERWADVLRARSGLDVANTVAPVRTPDGEIASHAAQ